jgi:hypothetical protein
MLHHIATISVCYGGHFEYKITAKIQKSSDLGEIWFPSRLWCCELIFIVGLLWCLHMPYNISIKFHPIPSTLNFSRFLWQRQAVWNF